MSKTTAPTDIPLGFSWRELGARPKFEGRVARVSRGAWAMFQKYHYLTAKVNGCCRFYCLFADGAPAAIAAMMVLPGKTKDIVACSRLVTLPDWQGLGLAMNLIDRVAACYAAIGRRVHTYPAHPALIRSFDRSPAWSLKKRPGQLSRGHVFQHPDTGAVSGRWGGRPNAVFEYVGARHTDAVEATLFLDGSP